MIYATDMCRISSDSQRSCATFTKCSLNTLQIWVQSVMTVLPSKIDRSLDCTLPLLLAKGFTTFQNVRFVLDCRLHSLSKYRFSDSIFNFVTRFLVRDIYSKCCLFS